MIVWGGDNGSYLNDGGRYNPVANSWTAVTTNGAPAARTSHTAVWTGSKMIVWGGYGGSYLNDGGSYNPAANSWRTVTTYGAPAARFLHTAVWTGSEMIVWGGNNGGGYSNDLNDGGRYNPVANSWTVVTTSGAPAARRNYTAVWTGSEMIVCAGWSGSSGYLNDTFSYAPERALYLYQRP
jgi:N-acetylneuraminic acid mutarotase